MGRCDRRRSGNAARLAVTVAVLCSGQGPQHPGMFALTGQAPAAIHLFAHAARLLGGRDPRDLVEMETDDALHANRLGQILCTLQPLAVAAALGGLGAGRLVVAGYSVGEVAAWGLAGLFEPDVTLDLAARRAQAMDGVARSGDGLLFRPRPRPQGDRPSLRAPWRRNRHRQSWRRFRVGGCW